MATFLSPLFNDQTFIPGTNTPASGYKLFTYAAGSSTKKTTYTDLAGTVPQSNPIIFNSSGFPTMGSIRQSSGGAYKYVLALPTDTDPPTSPLKTFDDIAGINDTASSTVSQWQPSGLTPTYISATSFTVPGDQTIELHVGRRVQFTTTAGTVYGVIASTALTALTTVGMTMDSGVLDSGLSAVNLSILRNDRSALPAIAATVTYVDAQVAPKAAKGANSDITSLSALTTGLAASRVQGLIGAPNAATPLTKYDLSADAVVLRNSTGGTVARYNTGTITNDLGLAGTAVNGRDQPSAFTINSWIYLYIIWNGATLATISTLAPPSVFNAATLPPGYTHWAFATVLRWDGASNIIPAFTCGSRVDYNLTENTGSPVNQVLTAGVATSFTAVDVSGFVPPISRIAKFNFLLSISDSRAAGTSFFLAVRPTGTSQFGQYICRFAIQITNTIFVATNWTDYPVSASQQIDYFINVVPSGLNAGAYILVEGYKISNGDS